MNCQDVLLLILVGCCIAGLAQTRNSQEKQTGFYKFSEGKVKRDTKQSTGVCGETNAVSKSDAICGKKICSAEAKTKGTNIAQKAAEVAKKAADSQKGLGEIAALEVRQHLADRAVQAAQAAEAALAGKQQVVEQIERDLRESQREVMAESKAFNHAKHSIKLLHEAANNAQKQHQMLLKAVRDAERNLSTAKSLYTGAQIELSEKRQLADLALQRLQNVQGLLHLAKKDYDKSKKYAYRAACAAAEAQMKVAKRNPKMI